MTDDSRMWAVFWWGYWRAKEARIVTFGDTDGAPDADAGDCRGRCCLMLNLSTDAAHCPGPGPGPGPDRLERE